MVYGMLMNVIPTAPLSHTSSWNEIGLQTFCCCVVCAPQVARLAERRKARRCDKGRAFFPPPPHHHRVATSNLHHDRRIFRGSSPRLSSRANRWGQPLQRRLQAPFQKACDQRGTKAGSVRQTAGRILLRTCQKTNTRQDFIKRDPPPPHHQTVIDLKIAARKLI